MRGIRTLVLACCALPAGCETARLIADRCEVPNVFGTSFRDRADVVANVPVGTERERAEAVMRAHGFELDSSRKEDDRLTLTFHRYDLTGLREPSGEKWVVLRLRRGAVVDVEWRDPPAAAAGGGPP